MINIFESPTRSTKRERFQKLLCWEPITVTNMNKLASIFAFIFLLTNITFAQSDEIDKLVEAGIALHDSGDYQGALLKYNEALKLDPNSALVNYEIAYTQMSLGNYSETIKHCDLVLKTNSNLNKDAYIIKGSALDNMGNSNEAIKVYKTGLKKFKNSFLLHYNIALTYAKINNLKEAEKHLQIALTNNPFHVSSSLLLSFIQKNNNLRIKYLASYTYFLLLEPKSQRAKNNSKEYYRILKPKNEYSVNEEGKISYNISISKESQNDEFNSTEFIYSINRAYLDKNTDENLTKSNFDKFSEQVDVFFLAMTTANLKSKSWWNFYVGFYSALYNSEHYSTAKYLLAMNLFDEEVDEWIELNKDSIQSYYKWHESYFYSK